MRRCRRQAPPFSGSAPTTFRLYRYSNEGRPPDGSGRNSYVSSNYSNFPPQNNAGGSSSRSSPPRRKRNRRRRPLRGDLRASRVTPSSTLDRSLPPAIPIHPLSTEAERASLSRFWGRSRKANAQAPSPLFPFAEFHPRRCDRDGGLELRRSMRDSAPPKLLLHEAASVETAGNEKNRRRTGRKEALSITHTHTRISITRPRKIIICLYFLTRYQDRYRLSLYFTRM